LVAPAGAEEVVVVYHQNSRLIDYFQITGGDGRLQKHYWRLPFRNVF